MFFSLLEKFKIRWMIPPAALVIGQVPFVPYLRMAGGHKPAHETEARNHNGGMLKDWVRDHLPTNTLIATTGDNEVYYLSGWRVRVLYYHPDLDETRWKTYRATSEDGLRFLKDLKAKGYQYVLDVRGSNGKYFSTLSQAAELALAKNSKALLFRGPDVLGQIGFVADLNAL